VKLGVQPNKKRGNITL